MWALVWKLSLWLSISFWGGLQTTQPWSPSFGHDPFLVWAVIKCSLFLRIPEHMKATANSPSQDEIQPSSLPYYPEWCHQFTFSDICWNVCPLVSTLCSLSPQKSIQYFKLWRRHIWQLSNRGCHPQRDGFISILLQWTVKRGYSCQPKFSNCSQSRPLYMIPMALGISEVCVCQRLDPSLKFHRSLMYLNAMKR